MDTNTIIKINSFQNIRREKIKFPYYFWLTKNVIYLKVIIHDEINYLTDNNSINICSESDLIRFFDYLSIEVSFDTFEIEIRDSDKWKKKPLFKEGNNSICFSIGCFIISKNIYLLFYNKKGARYLEALYLHGMWKIENGLNIKFQNYLDSLEINS